MFWLQTIDRTLYGHINDRFQPAEPVWVRVRVRLAYIILMGLRSSQERSKTLLFQLLKEPDEIFSTTEVRKGCDLLFSCVVFIYETKEPFLREVSLDANNDGGYRELSAEERCRHLSPQ